MDYLHFLPLQLRQGIDGQFAHKPEHFFVGRHITAGAAQELDRPFSIQGETHIFEHLSVAHFDDKEDARVFRKALEVQFWKRIESDGSQDPHADSFCPRLGSYGFQNSCYDPVSNKNNLRIPGVPLFGARFEMLGAEIFCFEIADMGFQLIALQVE